SLMLDIRQITSLGASNSNTLKTFAHGDIKLSIILTKLRIINASPGVYRLDCARRENQELSEILAFRVT
ncbi:hypothetical protein CHS0354_027101, partial [Potamilus streckersoni]